MMMIVVIIEAGFCLVSGRADFTHVWFFLDFIGIVRGKVFHASRATASRATATSTSSSSSAATNTSTSASTTIVHTPISTAAAATAAAAAGNHAAEAGVKRVVGVGRCHCGGARDVSFRVVSFLFLFPFVFVILEIGIPVVQLAGVGRVAEGGKWSLTNFSFHGTYSRSRLDLR